MKLRETLLILMLSVVAIASAQEERPPVQVPT